MTEDKNALEGEIVFYRAQNGATKVEVLYENEAFWLNQERIAELFGGDDRTISEHLQNVFSSGEHLREATDPENPESSKRRKSRG